MTYPPQSGGWPGQAGSGWPGQEPPGGGWQAPDTEVYLDPASGQPVYPTVPQYAPYPAYAPPVPAARQRRTNGMSIASLVVAIVGLLSSPCWGAGAAIGLVGAVLGHVGLRQTRQRDEEGGGLAIAGVTVGWVAVAIGIVALGLEIYFWIWVNQVAHRYNNLYPTDYPT